MYRNAQSHVGVDGAFTDDSLVQIGLYKGSLVSPLLFIIVMEALSKVIRS